MPLFSCVSPNAHGTLPRNSNSNPHNRVNSFAYGDIHRDATSNKNDPRPRPASTSFPSSSPNPITPARALTAKDLARKPGNGAKLQKRHRVSKSMIGTPKDFIHCSHLDKANAQQVSNSPEMAEITAALRSSSSSSNNNNDDKENDVRGGKVRTLVTPGPRPLSTTITRRKAPPPITPSIIKAAGLRESSIRTTGLKPSKPKTPSSSPLGKESNEKEGEPDSEIRDLRPARTKVITSPTSLHPPSSAQGKPDPLLPPTNSAITRDIERMLFHPIDGMPSSSEDPTNGLEPMPVGNQSGSVIKQEEGVSTEKEQEKEKERVEVNNRRALNTSETLQGLNLSPSMHDVFNRVVAAGEEEEVDKSTRA